MAASSLRASYAPLQTSSWARSALGASYDGPAGRTAHEVDSDAPVSTAVVAMRLQWRNGMGPAAQCDALPRSALPCKMCCDHLHVTSSASCGSLARWTGPSALDPAQAWPAPGMCSSGIYGPGASPARASGSASSRRDDRYTPGSPKRPGVAAGTAGRAGSALRPAAATTAADGDVAASRSLTSLCRASNPSWDAQ